MITGDKNIFKEGTNAHERYLLQRQQVDELKPVYWGRDARHDPSAVGFDIVTSQDPVWRGLVAKRIAKRVGAKLQIQIHTDLFSSEVAWWARWIALNWVLPYADTIRVVSEKAKQQLIERGIKAPIFVLPVFIDIEQVRAAPSADKKEFSQFSKILLVSARLEPEKEVEEALRIMKQVLAAEPKTAMLIAGSGSELKKLKALTRDLGIEKNVIFLGFREDMYGLYKIADCMLVTSRFESFGASMVEALAVGCPVVAPDVGVAKEAGANVVDRSELAQEVIKVLRSSERGELKITLLTREEWAQKWQKTL